MDTDILNGILYQGLSLAWQRTYVRLHIAVVILCIAMDVNFLHGKNKACCLLSPILSRLSQRNSRVKNVYEFRLRIFLIRTFARSTLSYVLVVLANV